MSDRSSPIFDGIRAGTAEIAYTEASAAGMSFPCACFSGLTWTWETFLSELSRAGAPELDAPGQGVMIPAGQHQPSWCDHMEGLQGRSLDEWAMGRGTEEGCHCSAELPPSSCQQDYFLWLGQGTGHWWLELGRRSVRGAHTTDIQRADHMKWGVGGSLCPGARQGMEGGFVGSRKYRSQDSPGVMGNHTV